MVRVHLQLWFFIQTNSISLQTIQRIYSFLFVVCSFINCSDYVSI